MKERERDEGDPKRNRTEVCLFASQGFFSLYRRVGFKCPGMYLHAYVSILIILAHQVMYADMGNKHLIKETI